MVYYSTRKNGFITSSILLLCLITFHFEFVKSAKEAKKPVLPVIPKPISLNNISTNDVFGHLINILQLSDLNTPYENSRARTRDYIVQALTTGTETFSGNQVFLHRFDWTDTTDSGGETVKTTWSGINVLAWTNTTVLEPGKQFSVVAARYDSQLWWSLENHGNTYPCAIIGSSGVSKSPKSIEGCSRSTPIPNLTSRVRSIVTAQELLGACVVIQLARSVMKYQLEQKKLMESISPLEAVYYWDKKDPSTIETGVYEESPVLFVLFDHESVGNLGSQVWAEYYGLGSQLREGKITSLTSIDFTGKYRPHDSNSKKTGTNAWQNLSPNYFISNDFFNNLLQPEDVLLPQKPK